jgi:hypothetical protein
MQLFAGGVRLFRFHAVLPKGHLQWAASLKRLRFDSATRLPMELTKP